MDIRIRDYAEKAAMSMSFPFPRFIASHWVAENGWTFPDDNNVGNISYTGVGNPDPIGVFAGVVGVQLNKVVNYATPADGVNAYTLLLNLPIQNKELDIDTQTLRDCSGDIRKMCEALGDSNWAGSHYNPGNGGWNGEDIFNVYNSPEMDALFAAITPPVETPTHPTAASSSRQYSVYEVVEGDTLTSISHRFLVPVAVLVRLNAIDDPNKISVGERVKIPTRYTVASGNTLSEIAGWFHSSVEEIASLNGLSNPDRIYPREVLFV